MTSWLLQQALITSCIIVSLLLFKRFALKLFGFNGIYLSWALLPVSLIAGTLPLIKQQNGSLNHYVVLLKESSEHFVEQFVPATTLIIALWLVIGFALTFLNIYSHRQYIRTLKLEEGSSHLLGLPAWLEGQIQKSRLTVCFSRSMHGPLVYGLFRPQLVIPCDFVERFDPMQRELVMLHELQHYKRGDLVWNFLAQMFVTLFWFNPLSWIGYAQYRQCQELACDQAVLSNTTKSARLAYAKALLLCQEQGKMISPTCLHYGVKNTMSERINSLKNQKQMSAKGLSIAAGVLLGAVFSINIAVAGANVDEKRDAYPIMRVEPKYPIYAAQNNIEGSVKLSFDIDKNGAVENVKVVESEPDDMFDRVATDALAKWKYETHGKKLLSMMVQLDFAMDSAIDEQHNDYQKGDPERIKVTK